MTKKLNTHPIEPIVTSLSDIDHQIEEASKIIRGHSLIPVLEEQRKALITSVKSEIRISKLQHWLIESKYGFHSAAIGLLAVTIVVLFGSYLLQLYYPNEAWFQRGGSIVVCAAVIFTFKNYTDELRLFTMFTPTYRDAHEMVFVQQYEQNQRDKNSITSMGVDQPLTKLNKGIETIFAYTNSEKIQRLVRNTLIIESTVIILGTIVWGYGDLIIK